jgi:hypothetical protein
MRSPRTTTGFAARLGALHVVASLIVLVLGIAASAGAQDRSDYFIRMLQTSTAFRVRAQAALSLGSQTPSPAITTALVAALRDDSAPVRAAAAQSLARVGDQSALSPLRALDHDSEAAVRQAATTAVAAIQARGTTSPSGPSTGGTGGGTAPPPSGPARYYVGVGDPGSTVSGIDPSILAAARSATVSALGAMSGIVVAPQGESASAARGVLRARSLCGFYLDVSITTFEAGADGTLRVAVSVVVQDYPGRDVRSMLSGRASASGISGVAAQRSVVQAAMQGALRGLGTAMAASCH